MPTQPLPRTSGFVVIVRRWPAILPVLILLTASAGMLLTAPVNGDFSWSDAPRHALNGAFILDLVRDHPWDRAAAWAMDYYIRYPSLTILFYPPFFYAVEAVFYAVFGVNHAAAQLSETLFIFLLGLAAYVFARQWLSRPASIGLALLTLGAPEIAYWDRQIMLDIPAYALGLFGMVFVCAFIRTAAPKYIYLAAGFLLAAIYTKFNVGFLLVPAAAATLTARGPRVLLQRQVLLTLTAGIIAAIPAMFMIFKFGSANVGSISGRPGDFARDSLDAWLFYASQMPHQLGYATILAAIAGVALALAARLNLRLQPWVWVMLIAWFVTGYVFFSAISVRESRHDLMILFPVLLLAAFAIATTGRHGGWILLALGAGTYCYSLVYTQPPVVSGYRAVAAYVATHAPPNGIIVFSGYRDGNFVFDMREHPERQDLTILRADKLLLKIAVERLRGVEQSVMTEDGIQAMLKSNGVGMVIAQQNFWQDLQVMARFTKVLDSNQFREVARFPLSGTLEMNDGRNMAGTGQVDILVPTYPVEPPIAPIAIDLPIIGQKITGQVKKLP